MSADPSADQAGPPPLSVCFASPLRVPAGDSGTPGGTSAGSRPPISRMEVPISRQTSDVREASPRTLNRAEWHGPRFQPWSAMLSTTNSRCASRSASRPASRNASRNVSPRRTKHEEDLPQFGASTSGQGSGVIEATAASTQSPQFGHVQPSSDKSPISVALPPRQVSPPTEYFTLYREDSTKSLQPQPPDSPRASGTNGFSKRIASSKGLSSLFDSLVLAMQTHKFCDDVAKDTVEMLSKRLSILSLRDQLLPADTRHTDLEGARARDVSKIMSHLLPAALRQVDSEGVEALVPSEACNQTESLDSATAGEREFMSKMFRSRGRVGAQVKTVQRRSAGSWLTIGSVVKEFDRGLAVC